MMIRYTAGALFLLTLSILTVSFDVGFASGGDFIKLPSEARHFGGSAKADGGDDDGFVGTRWAILLAGSNGYWNYRHQVIAIPCRLCEVFWF